MVRRQQQADRAIRPKLRSPGHPKFQRHVEVAFWAQIAKGVLPEEASATAGVAQAVGARWFRNAGGMAPFDINKQSSGRYLCFAEREEIAVLRAQGKGVRQIARTVGRNHGTISRELRRNAATRSGKSRVSGIGRSMEGRHVRTTTQGPQTRREQAAAHLRRRTCGRQDQRIGRHHNRTATAAEMDRAQQAPGLDTSVESRADRKSDQGRLPRL